MNILVFVDICELIACMQGIKMTLDYMPGKGLINR